MAKRKSRIPRQSHGKVNKAAMLREYLTKNPDANYHDVSHYFESKGLTVTQAQYYGIRKELKDNGVLAKSGKPRQVVSAKAAGSILDPEMEQEIYGGEEQVVTTPTPTIKDVLQARTILRNACQEAMEFLGDETAVAELLADIQMERRVAA